MENLVPVSDRLQVAVAHHHAGQFAEACAIYRAILAQFPQDPDALHLLGLALRAQGRSAAAAALIECALAVEPASAQVYFNLGNALGDFAPESAPTAYRRSLTLAPHFAQARQALVTHHVTLGADCENRGDRQEAIRHYRSAATLDPARARIHSRLTKLTYDQDPIEATEHAYRAWAAEPGNRDYYESLWHLLRSVGPGLPSERLNRYLFDQASYLALLVGGNFLRADGSGKAAEAMYRVARAMRPDLPFAGSRLGCLLATQHRFREADACFVEVAELAQGREQVIRLDPAFVGALPATLAVAADPIDPVPFGTGQVVVLASCDAGYFKRFAASLVGSMLEASGLDCVFHFHVVNPDGDPLEQVRALRAATGHAAIDVSVERVDAATLGPEPKTYYACSRFRCLPAVLDRYLAPVVLIDMDMLVLRPLQPLIDQLSEADFGWVGGEVTGLELWNTFWADFIVIRQTARSRRFFGRVAAYVDHFLKRGRGRWFLDQVALYAVFFAGFQDEPLPRVVLWPRDIHRIGAKADPGDKRPEDGPYLWSLHFDNSDNHAVTDSTSFRKYQPLRSTSTEP